MLEKAATEGLLQGLFVFLAPFILAGSLLVPGWSTREIKQSERPNLIYQAYFPENFKKSQF